MSRTPQRSDSSLSLRTIARRNTPDFKAVAMPNASIVDERVFGDGDYTEHDRLLPEMINMEVCESKPPKKKRSCKCINLGSIVQTLFITLMLGLFIVIGVTTSRKQKQFQKLYYNGTHFFDNTVIFISLDGFRSDYFERQITPNMQELANQGIKAEHMYPSFPSITFPNHWTLATGLYPESHGIVANEFYDPALEKQFVHTNASVSIDPVWWKGEPIWITATKQGKKSAVMMWPGSNVAIQRERPDYYLPYDETTSTERKMDIALNWLDLPDDERPQSISIYIPRVDQKGHAGGPYDNQMNTILIEMDDAVGHLVQGLKERNLDSHVHLVIVSDHGMVDTKLQDIIFYDDILSEQSISYMSDREAWPLLGIRTKQDAPDTALETIYQEILNYTKSHTSHFQVFKRSEVPLRYHYSNNERIAPIVMIPDIGYVILHSEEHLEMPLGIHGYDNTAPEMRAIFVAKGPTIKQRVTLSPFYNIEVYSLISHLLGLAPSENNATLSVSEFIKSL